MASEDGLESAWRAAEAALPPRWHLMGVMQLWDAQTGRWQWEASACGEPADIARPPHAITFVQASSPAMALVILAEKLAEVSVPGGRS